MYEENIETLKKQQKSLLPKQDSNCTNSVNNEQYFQELILTTESLTVAALRGLILMGTVTTFQCVESMSS
jgi:hypothetical protein